MYDQLREDFSSLTSHITTSVSGITELGCFVAVYTVANRNYGIEIIEYRARFIAIVRRIQNLFDSCGQLQLAALAKLN